MIGGAGFFGAAQTLFVQTARDVHVDVDQHVQRLSRRFRHYGKRVFKNEMRQIKDVLFDLDGQRIAFFRRA